MVELSLQGSCPVKKMENRENNPPPSTAAI
jgi:hypothetical protein